MNRKLASNFLAFQVHKGIGIGIGIGWSIARLELHAIQKIHSIFHVPLLRRKVGEAEDVLLTLPPHSLEDLHSQKPKTVVM